MKIVLGQISDPKTKCHHASVAANSKKFDCKHLFFSREGGCQNAKHLEESLLGLGRACPRSP